MSFKSISLITSMVFAMALWSCSSESVNPQKADSGSSVPTLAADVGDGEHNYPNDICSEVLRYNLISESGSEQVDYCGFLPCGANEPLWGSIEVFNNQEALFISMDLAFGWFIELNESFIGVESNLTWINGIPQSETNWVQTSVYPIVTTYQAVIPAAAIPECFSIASKITAVKLDLFGGTDPSSSTSLWLRNPDWNNSNNPDMNSSSQYVTNWCMRTCGPVTTTSTDGDCSGCDSENTVTFYDCESVDVSSCKDLSNVVLVYDDCSTEKFDNLSSHTGTFTGTGANAGKVISHIYVKSGCNKSYEGPGYGRRFDSPCLNSNCASSGNGNGGNGNGGNGNGKNK